ncbi:MAG: hypothetical protein ACFFAB_13705 [Candidatus Heimdallarchaeota archaeon]
MPDRMSKIDVIFKSKISSCSNSRISIEREQLEQERPRIDKKPPIYND